jgi:hypothetical protein
LLHKIHLERATDTTILESDEVVILLCDYSTLLNEFSINIYLTYIVDYHSKSYPLAIAEDTIKKSSFAASEVARQQQNRDIIYLHIGCIKQSIY